MVTASRPSPDSKGFKVVLNLPSDTLRQFPPDQLVPCEPKTTIPQKDGPSRRTKLGKRRNTSLSAQNQKQRRNNPSARRAAQQETRVREEEEHQAKKNAELKKIWDANSAPPLQIDGMERPVELKHFLRMSDDVMPLSYPAGARRIVEEGDRLIETIARRLELKRRGQQIGQADQAYGQESDSEQGQTYPSIYQPQPVRPPPAFITHRPLPEGHAVSISDNGIDIPPFRPNPSFLPVCNVWTLPQQVHLGHYDSNNIGYHNDVAARNNMNPSNLMYKSLDPVMQSNFSYSGVEMERDQEKNDVKSRLAKAYGLAELEEPISCPAARSPTTGAMIQHHGVMNHITQPTVKESRSVPLPLYGRNADFVWAQIVSDIRIAARNMSDARRGRIRYKSMVASETMYEAKWRKESRGKSFEDTSQNGPFQEMHLLDGDV